MSNRVRTVLSFLEANKNIKLICLSAIVFSFGDGLFTFLLPVFISELNAAPADIGMLYAVYNLTWGITLMFGGFLADRFDQKKIMILSSLIWAPVPLIFAVTTDWNQLWLPMILYGTYFGSASCSVCILRSIPREKVMQAFGIWSASVGLGYVFSPIVGGLLSSILGKETVFFLAALFFGVSTVPLAFISKYKQKKPVETEIKSEFDPQSTNTNNRLRIIGLCVFFAIIMFAVFLLNPLIPQYTHGVYHQTIFNLGVFGTAASAGWVFFAITFGRIGDKRSKMTVVLASTVITSISFLLIVMINNFPLLCLASFLSGASSAIFGFMQAIIGSAAPERSAGRWISISQTSVTIAVFGAPIIGGVLYEVSPYLAFSVAIIVLFSLTIVGVLKKMK